MSQATGGGGGGRILIDPSSLTASAAKVKGAAGELRTTESTDPLRQAA